jgi:hypothetical protein
MGMLAASSAVPAQDQAATRLTLTEKDGAYHLAVPVSRLILTIPKGRLVASTPANASDSPLYFYFEEHEKALVLSGWFEPEGSFRGMKEFWADERTAMTKQGLDPQDVVQEQIGKWNTVFYDLLAPGGRNANVRAEWIQAGTWIDLHVSLTADEPTTKLRAELRERLAKMQVLEKSP